MYRRLSREYVRESVAQSSRRTYRSGWRASCAFRGLIGESEYLSGEADDTVLGQALLEFVAWCCAGKGNVAPTISGKLAAVQYFHRVDRQVYAWRCRIFWWRVRM